VLLLAASDLSATRDQRLRGPITPASTRWRSSSSSAWHRTLPASGCFAGSWHPTRNGRLRWPRGCRAVRFSFAW